MVSNLSLSGLFGVKLCTLIWRSPRQQPRDGGRVDFESGLPMAECFSADGGANWSPFNDGLANLQVRALAVGRGTPHAVYAAGPGGVFKILDE